MCEIINYNILGIRTVLTIQSYDIAMTWPQYEIGMSTRDLFLFINLVTFTICKCGTTTMTLPDNWEP